MSDDGRKTIRGTVEDLTEFEKLAEQSGGQVQALATLIQAYKATNHDSPYHKQAQQFDAFIEQARAINRGIIAQAEIETKNATEFLVQEKAKFEKDRLDWLNQKRELLERLATAEKLAEEQSLVATTAKRASDEAEARAKSSMAALEREQNRAENLKTEMDALRKTSQELAEKVALTKQLQERVGEQASTIGNLNSELESARSQIKEDHSKIRGLEAKISTATESEKQRDLQLARYELSLQGLQTQLSEKTAKLDAKEAEFKAAIKEEQEKASRLAKAEAQAESATEMRVLQEKISTLHERIHERISDFATRA